MINRNQNKVNELGRKVQTLNGKTQLTLTLDVNTARSKRSLDEIDNPDAKTREVATTEWVMAYPNEVVTAPVSVSDIVLVDNELRPKRLEPSNSERYKMLAIKVDDVDSNAFLEIYERAMLELFNTAPDAGCLPLASSTIALVPYKSTDGYIRYYEKVISYHREMPEHKGLISKSGEYFERANDGPIVGAEGMGAPIPLSVFAVLVIIYCAEAARQQGVQLLTYQEVYGPKSMGEFPWFLVPEPAWMNALRKLDEIAKATEKPYVLNIGGSVHDFSETRFDGVMFVVYGLLGLKSDSYLSVIKCFNAAVIMCNQKPKTPLPGALYIVLSEDQLCNLAMIGFGLDISASTAASTYSYAAEEGDEFLSEDEMTLKIYKDMLAQGVDVNVTLLAGSFAPVTTVSEVSENDTFIKEKTFGYPMWKRKSTKKPPFNDGDDNPEWQSDIISQPDITKVKTGATVQKYSGNPHNKKFRYNFGQYTLHLYSGMFLCDYAVSLQIVINKIDEGQGYVRLPLEITETQFPWLGVAIGSTIGAVI